ncbi:SDR family NAD(P)-dependent oxidoreductase [Limimaricola pyoseonensis]|uniref:Meso-butanediol dehydrogenase / (S,S)-butanediol dehydrogenase / diacetyl reductase n=1 Tax=Limimaricola pyoseonensis TaxID=521013 RepID=A0A1G7D9C9_9RHOB|nr:SDR family NAD(P)-dependent oxidoreductase [Limimaricola pyoseonensis]SDE48157.1 meso-butanediol dehydrogenase / (S,S)-butanediol dehydrogenase / diacetyl reductase [Limimaricola pyoseonensis]
MRYKGKTVLVTGAASGIGAATARRFSQEGANVVLSDTESKDLERVARDLPSAHTRTFAGDIAKPGDCEAMVACAVENFGGLDILVPNAGFAVVGPMEDVSDENFAGVIENNLTGTYRTIKAAWEPLKKARGAIIATSSVSGMRGDFGAFAYATSKAGISNMVRSLALDFQRHGIRVNAVAPGFTETGLTEDMMKDEKFLERMHARIPMGRDGQPEEIAAVIAFLASDDASFVNGVIMPVDGGLTASNGQPPLA